MRGRFSLAVGGLHSYAVLLTASDTRNVMPFVGGHARAGFELGHFLIGLEGVAEKDFGDVTHVEPTMPGWRQVVSRPSSAARLGGGLFVGGRWSL